MIKIYWCHRRDTNQSEPCLNPSGQNLSIRRFNKGQLYDLSRLRGTALEAETLQWSCQQKHWCGVFPDNFRPLCQRRHLQNVKNLQVGVFHSMSKVWQQHICRQMKFSFCYHSEILLAATTGRHSAAAGVTADTRSASFSTGIPKWRDLFKSRLWGGLAMLSQSLYSSPLALSPLSVLIRRPSPHYPLPSPPPPSPLHPGPGLLDPSSDTPCQSHFHFGSPSTAYTGPVIHCFPCAPSIHHPTSRPV